MHYPSSKWILIVAFCIKFRTNQIFEFYWEYRERTWGITFSTLYKRAVFQLRSCSSNLVLIKFFPYLAFTSSPKVWKYSFQWRKIISRLQCIFIRRDFKRPFKALIYRKTVGLLLRCQLHRRHKRTGDLWEAGCVIFKHRGRLSASACINWSLKAMTKSDTGFLVDGATLCYREWKRQSRIRGQQISQ